MTGDASDEREVPVIERVQHNVVDADIPFEADTETEYTTDFEHEGASVRLVLSNGNCIEYHRLDAETLVECAFVEVERADGERELLLDSTHKTRRADVTDADAFLETVAESVAFYRREVDTVTDAERLWDNVVPVVED